MIKSLKDAISFTESLKQTGQKFTYESDITVYTIWYDNGVWAQVKQAKDHKCTTKGTYREQVIQYQIYDHRKHVNKVISQ